MNRIISESITRRVRYSDTDQMGFMHHSNYARYYEDARTALFRKLGLPYSEVEKEGLLLPVVKMDAHFKQPLRYEEEFTVRTWLEKMPASTISFYYEIENENNEVVHTAKVVLAFLSANTGKACRPPHKLLNLLSGNNITEH
ncbi:MAG: acyl-CoA thioesterase [Prolixibacteraceae bacterium]|nr:acyl-CoA thioesterase [Prolixibacteraceae bacterium]MBN2648846.1 acyl-CoA thioesterase [Prolixibacteraceae bacterium]